MSEDLTYIGFPAGVNKKCLEGVSYELDKDTDTLTITYAGKIYDFSLKSKSPYLIERYGVKKIQTVERVSGYLILFLLAAFFLYLCLLGRIEYSKQFFLAFFIICYGLIILFYAITEECGKIESFYRDSRCKRCGRDFAYEEYKDPLIREVSSRPKYEINITRYWECKFCGHKDTRTEELHYSQGRGEREDRKKTCSECNKEYAMIEYKLPEIKFINDIATTIRHYKCTFCGYNEITIEEEYIPD